MATPPTLVFYQRISGTATTKTSNSFTFVSGDVCTVIAEGAGANAAEAINTPTTTLAGNTFAPLQTINAGSPAAHCEGGSWTFTASAGGAATVQATCTFATTEWTLTIRVERNATAATGARSASATGSSRTLSYTPSQVDSSIHWASGDWAAAAVQTETPTSSTHNASTPGPTALPDNFTVAGQYTVNSDTLDDQTSTGAVSYGITGTGTGPFTIFVVEVQGSGAAAATGTQMPRLVDPRKRPARVGRILPHPIGVPDTSQPAPAYPGQSPSPVPRRLPSRRRTTVRSLPLEQTPPPVRPARRTPRPSLRPVRRPAEPVPVAGVPATPSYVSPSVRRGFKGIGLRRRRPAEVVPPQVVVTPSVSYVPQPPRRVLRGLVAARRRPAEPPHTQRLVLPTPRPRVRLVPLLRRRPAEVIHQQARIVPSPPRRVVRGVPLLRRRPAEAPSTQTRPSVPPRRVARLVPTRRRRPAEVTPPQVVVTPPAYVPVFARRGLKGLQPRRRTRAEVVPPQQAAAVAPKYLSAPPRRGLKGLSWRRGRSIMPVPPQQAVPAAPTYVPVPPRRGLKGVVTRRRSTLTPVTVQQVPVLPRRRSTWRPVTLRRRTVPPAQLAPVIDLRRRQTRVVPPRRRRRPAEPVPRQVVLSPSLVPIARRSLLRRVVSRLRRPATPVPAPPRIPAPAVNPRVVLVRNAHRAMMVANADAAVLVHNLFRAALEATGATAVLVHNTFRGVVMDSYVAGDLLPDLACQLYDGNAPFDPSTATSITVKVWQDGALLVTRAGNGASTGLVTMPWQGTETATPGPFLVRVTLAYANGKTQSFPPDGYMRGTIHPASP